MVELGYTPDLGSGLEIDVGSTPTIVTNAVMVELVYTWDLKSHAF